MVSMEIRRRDGTVITVRGTESEVEKVISLLDANGGKKLRAKRNGDRQRSRTSIADMIHELSDGGFFDRPRSLTDIKNALDEKGRFYPSTTLSGIVLGLVRQQKLGRIRHEDLWKYVRR